MCNILISQLQIKNTLYNTKVLDLYVNSLSNYSSHLITKMVPMIIIIITLAK